MAIDNRLQVFNEEGQSVDYDILANDVKFLPDGKDLPTKLAEMEEEIGEGGYTPPQGGIPKTDLEPSVQQTLDDVANKVDKETGKGLSTNDYTTAEKTKLQNLPTATELTTQLGQKANDNAVVKSVSVNGTAQTKDQNGNVNINVQGGLTKEDISVETQGDGTVDINVKDDKYTINLNHTHEAMAKVVVDTDANLPDPSEMDEDTVYGVLDNGALVALYVGGYPFYAGSGDGTPLPPDLTSPTEDFDLGTIQNGSASGTVLVKGKRLTAPLTLSFTANSGFTFDTSGTLPAGVSVDNSGVMTITAEAAIAGVTIPIQYTGGDFTPSATLSIVSVTDNIDESIRVSASSGYTALDYVDNAATGFLTNIDSVVTSGSGQNQTFVAGTKWTVDVQMMSNPTGDDQFILGSSFDVGHWFGALRNGHFGCGNANSSSPNNNVFLSDAVLGTRSVIEVEFVNKGIKATYNGATCARYSTNDFNHWRGSNGVDDTGSYAILKVSLFDDMNYPQSGLYKGRVYGIKCIHNGVSDGLFFDGVPAQRNSDNKKGLYDRVSQIFYPIEL